MDLKDVRNSIMQAENITDLYNAELDLTEYIGTLHKNVVLSDTIMDQSDAKSLLTMANALLGICRERQAEVRDLGARLNYNFRMAAKAMLVTDTYNAIMQKAHLPRKEVKSETGELKSNRYKK